MDYPGSPPLPTIISTYSRYGVAMDYAHLQASLAPASSTWPVANTAFYVPIIIPFPYPVRRIFWYNGSSVASTNMDAGIYTDSGTRLYSTGSTAASGASVKQYVTLGTELLLTPGRYYLALADSSTTANRGGFAAAGTVARNRQVGILQEASALPLPATMTGAQVANAYIPVIGVTKTASGFA